jgi:hypothetical protein
MRNYWKKAALLTCFGASLAASSAAADFTGYGEIFTAAGYQALGTAYQDRCGSSDCGSGSYRGRADNWDFGGSAHGNINFDNAIGLQLDLGGTSNGFNSDSISTNGFGAHVYYRDADDLWGGLFSIGDTGYGRAVTLGLEGQAYLGDVTLYSQLSYTAAIQGDIEDYRYSGWNLYNSVRYFLSDKLAFSAGIGLDYANFSKKWPSYDEAYGAHADSVYWQLKAEYQLDALPLSVFAAYQGSYAPWRYASEYDGGNYKYETGYNSVRNGLLIGVRFYFGQNDLKTNDRTGASLEDFNPWYGRGGNILDVLHNSGSGGD